MHNTMRAHARSASNTQTRQRMIQSRHDKCARTTMHLNAPPVLLAAALCAPHSRHTATLRTARKRRRRQATTKTTQTCRNTMPNNTHTHTASKQTHRRRHIIISHMSPPSTNQTAGGNVHRASVVRLCRHADVVRTSSRPFHVRFIHKNCENLKILIKSCGVCTRYPQSLVAFACGALRDA